MSENNEKFGKEYFMENNMIKDIKREDFKNEYTKNITNDNYINRLSDTEEIQNHKNFEPEKYSLRNELKEDPSTGIILSYGEGDEIVPAGSYAMTRVVDGSSNPSIRSEEGLNIFVEFVEVEYIEDRGAVRKEPGNKIYIPYDVYISKVFKERCDANTETIGRLSDDYVGRGEVAFINDEMADYLKYEDPGTAVSGMDFAGMSLTDARAVLVSPNGARRATNYTIFPVSYGMIRRLEKVLVKTRNPEKKDKEREMAPKIRYTPGGIEYVYEEEEKDFKLPDRETEPGSMEIPPRIIEPGPTKLPEREIDPIPERPPIIFYEDEERERTR